MSIPQIFNRKFSNSGTPIDPNPRQIIQRKSPPLLLRFNLAKTFSTNAIDINLSFSNTTRNFSLEKSTENKLPPILPKEKKLKKKVFFPTYNNH